jgi:Domain of unknown function (DUF4177)
MRWEYKIVYFDTIRWTSTGLPDDLNAQFDRWGAEGWELSRTEPILHRGWLGGASYTVGIIAFFKRQMTG